MPTSDPTIGPNIFAGLLVSAPFLAFLFKATANYIEETGDEKRKRETESPHIPSAAPRTPRPNAPLLTPSRS